MRPCDRDRCPALRPHPEDAETPWRPGFPSRLLSVLALALMAGGCPDPAAPSPQASQTTRLTAYETHRLSADGDLSILRAGRVLIAETPPHLRITALHLRTRLEALWPLLRGPADLFPLGQAARRDGPGARSTPGPMSAAHPTASPEPDPTASTSEPTARTAPTPGTSLPSAPSLDPHEPIQISSDRFAGDLTSRQGVFQGHVRFTWGSLYLTCDQVTLRAGHRGEAVPAALVAQGRVEITWGDWRGRADTVTYDLRTQHLVLKGDPQLEGRGLRLSGPYLTVDMTTGSVRCEPCQAHWRMEVPR